MAIIVVHIDAEVSESVEFNIPLDTSHFGDSQLSKSAYKWRRYTSRWIVRYVIDTVEFRKRDIKTKQFVASRRRVLFDFNQSLHDGRWGPCHHFTAQWFSGPVNSLAANGKNRKKSAPNTQNKHIEIQFQLRNCWMVEVLGLPCQWRRMRQHRRPTLWQQRLLCPADRLHVLDCRQWSTQLNVEHVDVRDMKVQTPLAEPVWKRPSYSCSLHDI